MVGFCLRCSKDLADKRKGTEYCSTTCRAARWQKAKRIAARRATPVELNTEEVLKLMAKGTSFIQLFGVAKQMDDVVGGDEISELTKVKAELLEWCRLMGGHPILLPKKKK